MDKKPIKITSTDDKTQDDYDDGNIPQIDLPSRNAVPRDVPSKSDNSSESKN